jgi:uncharacterized protein YcbK (DUF882 family)
MRAVARLTVVGLGVWVGSITIGGNMAFLGVISLDDYFMGREVEFKDELTDEIRHNALELITRVNKFLADNGITLVKVSSGWRPPSINSTVPNAAKKSLHMVGKAVDIRDRDRRLARLFLRNTKLLAKHGLWMEEPSSTPRWVHLDIGNRRDRAVRVFKP